MAFMELLPELRPYQRRAIYWMIEREQGTTRTSYQSPITDPDATLKSENHSNNAGWSEHPLWVPVASLDGMSRFFYNPYRFAMFFIPS
jgi:E3 ubiquitin-protein ligase SHPRH